MAGIGGAGINCLVSISITGLKTVTYCVREEWTMVLMTLLDIVPIRDVAT